MRGRLVPILSMVALAVVALPACRGGGSDVDVEEAARELEAAATAVLSTIAPEGALTVGVAVRPCIDAINRETGESIGALTPGTAVAAPDLADASVAELADRAREALRAHGFGIDERFPGEAVRGLRDGITLVITPMPSAGGVGADGSTGCRPPA